METGDEGSPKHTLIVTGLREEFETTGEVLAKFPEVDFYSILWKRGIVQCWKFLGPSSPLNNFTAALPESSATCCAASRSHFPQPTLKRWGSQVRSELSLGGSHLEI